MNFSTRHSYFFLMILLYESTKTMCFMSNCGSALPPLYPLDCFHVNTIKSTNNTTSSNLKNPNSSILEVDTNLNLETKNSKCCFLKNVTDITGETNLCYLVDNYSKYTNDEDQIYYLNGVEFEIDCDTDSSDKATGQLCGIESPSNFTDCTKYSISGNSCCFYKNFLTNSTSCFWLGRFTNIINVINNSSNCNVTCSATKLRYSFIYIILLLTLI
jgi:hypothetical protein